MQLDFSVRLDPSQILPSLLFSHPKLRRFTIRFYPMGEILNLLSQVYNTLLVDKNHRNPSAAQAASSLARCALAAIMVSFLENLIDGIGIGWTFTFMGGLCLASTGLFWVDWKWGMKWRQRALAKSRERGHA